MWELEIRADAARPVRLLYMRCGEIRGRPGDARCWRDDPLKTLVQQDRPSIDKARLLSCSFKMDLLCQVLLFGTLETPDERCLLTDEESETADALRVRNSKCGCQILLPYFFMIRKTVASLMPQNFPSFRAVCHRRRTMKNK